jgi:hypothetical protein
MIDQGRGYSHERSAINTGEADARDSTPGDEDTRCLCSGRNHTADLEEDYSTQINPFQRKELVNTAVCELTCACCEETDTCEQSRSQFLRNGETYYAEPYQPTSPRDLKLSVS